ncbi:serine/threonine protein phosphatase 1 [Sulfitobacter brevis]|uniref:Serine/threonine protein phosphatase 1 n=1 Tax=Sulfitobacter brevis TaxID=74348 RepID=A0A1I1W097_9RHOB|nr:metallophosphoesterase family protein [Sulfitobacter brevis]SFD88541.1 serine/threonine protein phosphatase 1 [Sulfitobacter brevis]
MPKPIYAIGDIHGQKAELDRVLDLIEQDGGKEASIVFLGDYVDRGPDSRAVLDTLIAGRDLGRDWTFLMGNHDRMFAWFLQDYPRHDAYLPIDLNWLHPRLGGDTTLASYGIHFTSRDRMLDVHAQARSAVPPAHLHFVHSLKLSHETQNHFFAHAGIRPDVPLADQDQEDLLWIRKEFHRHSAAHLKLVVHGHTPVQAATHYGNRVNLDSGAGYGNPLSVAVFENQQSWLLSGQGRTPLTPA